MVIATHRTSRVLSVSLLLVALGVAGCSKPPSKVRKVAKEDLAEATTGAEKAASKPSREPLGPIPEGPVAKVGDVPVSRDAFMTIYELKLQKYKDRDRAIPRSADRRYREHITDRLVYQEILRQECAKLGVDYDEAALVQRYETQKKGLRDWGKHLRKRGESDASLKEQLKAELRERAILKHTGKLAVSEADIKTEYERVSKNYDRDAERVRASHILFSPFGKGPRPGPSDAPEAAAALKEGEAKAMARAEEVYAKATAPGADFAALAREYSDGPSGPKGGDLGIFSKERMVPEFSEAAFALKVGEVSKPVKTKFGVHLIKVNGIFAPGPLPLEALQDQLRDRLFNQRVHRGRRELKQALLGAYAVDNLMKRSLPPAPTRPQRSKLQRNPSKMGPPAKGTALGRAEPAKATDAKADPAKAEPAKAPTEGAAARVRPTEDAVR